MPFSSSPPGLTRWSMLKCSAGSRAEPQNQPLRRMDCRIKSGNDEVRTKEIREAKRRQTRVTPPARKHGARVAPRKERLAPPFPLSGALACQRSTTALPRGGVLSLGAIRARLRGPTVQGAGVTPPTAKPTSSDAPRTPVLVPAGMMPGPPGSQADEASPAGTALAPAARHHPDGVPSGRDDSRPM
jgi:hypothetical protein